MSKPIVFIPSRVPREAIRYLQIGEKELSMMRPDVFFINASRGGVVDEAALIRLCRNGG